MAKSKGLLKKYISGFLWIVVIALFAYLILRNLSVSSNIIKALIGLGLIILIHESGHFFAAKLSGIKVEAFSIFAPPILLGIRRTKDGLRFRILPWFFAKENDESGDGLLSFTVGKKAKAGETEYRIGLIPFGGFVKMLGQEDMGPVKASDDPRSFANKPVGVRMSVITSGVVFNALSAIIIFVIVFLVGIKLAPPVVGGVMADSPAERAGLKAGDEVIEIDGKTKDLDFSSIAVAAALSDTNEAIAMKVKHEDGAIEDFAIVAEQLPGEDMKVFGIAPPLTLIVADVSNANSLLEKTGLMPGDEIVSVNGMNVIRNWELTEVIRNSIAPEITIEAKREDELIKSQIRMDLLPMTQKVETEADLSHIYSMVPRLQVTSVSEPVTLKDKIISLLNRLLIKIKFRKKNIDSKLSLKQGDIILAIGEEGNETYEENPTYKELRDITTDYENKELPIKVLRAGDNGTEEILTISVVPRRSKDKVLIGITLPFLDAEHPVVAKCIDTGDELGKPAIPRGATITAVDLTPVSSWYDIIREISKYPGERITIDWRLDEEMAGDVAINVGPDGECAIVKSLSIPFEPLEKLYRASGPINALVMGCRRTGVFIAQTYATLKGLITRTVELKNAKGPVGIVTYGYFVAQRPVVYQLYLFGLVSACIAVVNFLPLLPFDGGYIVFLLIEKIKGSAVSERIQTTVLHVGWILVGLLFLYITFNDIVSLLKLIFA